MDRKIDSKLASEMEDKEVLEKAEEWLRQLKKIEDTEGSYSKMTLKDYELFRRCGMFYWACLERKSLADQDGVQREVDLGLDRSRAMLLEPEAFAREPLLPTEKERIEEALRVAHQYGGNDGADHLQWTIDQMVRVLAPDYNQFVLEHSEMDHSEDWNVSDWCVGTAPAP